MSLMQRASSAAQRSFRIAPMSLKDPALAKLFGEGYRTTSGVSVTEANAFTFSAVFNAVLQIANDVSKLPLNLRKRRQEGGSDDYVASPLYNMLKVEPNEEMGSMELRRTLTAHALTCHGGYAEIERNGAGGAVGIWPLTPDRVRPYREKIRNNRGEYVLGRLEYEIDGKNTLAARDVLHIHGLGYDGYCGYPMIQKARQAIGLALAAEQFGASFFGNGSTFGGLLTTEADIDEEAAKDQRALIESYHQSAERAHRLLVLAGGWTYTSTGVEPQKAQMDELRSTQIEEVARFFRMPPYRLGVNKPGTVSYASVEMANLDYYTGALLDWVTTWEQELNRKLIPKLERRQQFIKHNASAFLRADIKTRYDSYSVMLDRGVFCADDVLELEDMNPQPGGIGKMYLVQGAQVPKNKIEAIADSAIKKNETPAPAPPKTPASDGDTQVQVDEANARALAAETVAAEARAASASEREARIAAEASGTATREELERRTVADRESAALASQLTAMAESLRADVAGRQVALDEANAELMTVAEERGAAVVRADSSEAARAAAVEEAETARQQASQSEQAAEQARQEAADAAQARQAALAASLAAAALADQAQGDAERALSDRVAAEGLRAAADLAAGLARADVDRLSADLAALTDVSAGLGAERDALSVQLQQAGDAAESARHTVTSVEADRARLQADIDAALAAEETIRAESQAAIAEAAERARQADEARAVVAAALEAARHAAADVEAERNRLNTEIADAVVREASTRAESDAALATATQLIGVADEARVREAEARSAADAIAAQAVADTETAIAARDAATAERDQARAESESRRTEHRQAIEQLEHRLTEAERQRSETRQASVEGAAAVLSAHRALIVDVMRRMIERESDRIRRAQQSPEKLTHAIETFYAGHEELCNIALLPAVRVHLAWTQSSEDPIALTRRLVAQHVEQSIRQLRTVLDGDAGELAVSVTALLRQWETERVNQIGDVVLQRGIEHARNRHT